MSQVGQVPGPGQVADLGLGQAALQERVADAVLARGPHAGAVVAGVVGVGPRGDHVGPERAEQPGEPAVELALAEVAAVGVVPQVVRVGELLGADHSVADADPAGQRLGLLELARGQAVGNRRHGHGGVAQRHEGGLGDDRAVDPPEYATATRPYPFRVASNRSRRAIKAGSESFHSLKTHLRPSVP